MRVVLDLPKSNYGGEKISSVDIHGTKIKDTCKRIWCKIRMIVCVKRP
jgi:hypothetical protein